MNEQNASPTRAAAWKTLAPHRAARATPRTVMLAACAGVGLVGALGFVTWRAKQAARSAASPSALAQHPQPVSPEPSTLPQPSGVTEPGVTGAGAPFIQFVDAKDPTRIAGEVTADRSTPLQGRRMELEAPRAWFFQNDGTAIYVEAQRGRMTRAAGDGGPSDGFLEGDVHIRVFSRTAHGKRPDPSKDPAVLDVRTARLSIDWTLGQLDMPEEVRVAATGVFFHGRGVMLQFDPATHRVDRLSVAALLEPITWDPGEESAAAGLATTQSTQAPAQPPAQPPAQSLAHADTNAAPSQSAIAAQPGDAAGSIDSAVESWYMLTATQDVHIERDGRSVEGPLLRGWVRTIANRLAVGPREHAGEAALTPSNTPPRPAAEAAGTATIAQIDPLPTNAPSASQRTTLFWKGPLDIVRLAAAPEQLALNNALVSVAGAYTYLGPEQTTSEPSNQSSLAPSSVTISDSRAGLRATGSALTYALDQERVVLEGAPDAPAQVFAEKGGVASAPRIEVDIPGALIRVPGAGSWQSEQAGSNDKAHTANANNITTNISWGEHAEFKLSTLRGRSSIERAQFMGGFRAQHGAATIEATQSVVEFAHATPPSPTPSPAPVSSPAFPTGLDASGLERVTLLGAVHAHEAKGTPGAGEAHADMATLQFARTTPQERAQPANPELRSLTLTGHASTSRNGDTLRGDEVTATFDAVADASPREPQTQGAMPKVRLATVLASKDVELRGRNGQVATGTRLEANLRRQVALIEGSPARIEQGENSITSPRFDADGTTQRIAATGPGELHTSLPAQSAATPASDQPTTQPATLARRTLSATWTQSLTIDDRAGTLVATGSAIVNASEPTSPDASSRTGELRGSSVTVSYNRAEPASSSAQPPSQASTPNQAPTSPAPTTVLKPQPATQTTNEPSSQPQSQTQTPAPLLPFSPASVRTVRSVLATGTTADPAQCELTWLSPAGVVNRLVHARGEALDFDASHSILSIPSAGFLLTSNRAAQADPAPIAAPPAATSSVIPDLASGKAFDALLTWRGSARVDLGSGTAHVERSVRLIHKPVESALNIFEADTLDAALARREDGVLGDLTSATLLGGMWAKSGDRELSASRALYNASTGVLEALGENADVVVTNPAGEPLRAGAIRWDMRAARIDVVDPSSIGAGR